MHKNLDTWYKGVCHAPGIVVEEELSLEEEALSLANAEEEPDLDLTYDELESIKRRLKELRSMLLVIKPDPCELATNQGQRDFLSPKQKMLLQLRHSNCVLRCQLDRIVQRLHATRREVKALEALRCQLRDRISSMTEELAKFARFKQDAIHMFGVCIERDEQIKACKVDEQDFNRRVKLAVQHNESRMRYLAPLRCHHELSYNVSMELIFMRLFLQSLFNRMVEGWNQCKQHDIP
ncbi:hypothetical protein KR222_006826 [Zaprionus bogoriensis]|nr:hypothetical protein KR222_006826 [Zaprionus bogoriensis]